MSVAFGHHHDTVILSAWHNSVIYKSNVLQPDDVYRQPTNGQMLHDTFNMKTFFHISDMLSTCHKMDYWSSVT